jgi:hypothetical protein|tara:strand:- start:182 stop:904 length:723 start_codon:yes stop_codon:yes gene_type:complete
MVELKSSQINTKGKFDTKLRKARLNWVKDYKHSIELTLRNAGLLEMLRRTVRPLKLYRKFLEHIDISTRTAQRLVSIGTRDKESNILTNHTGVLPNQYATIEILLRLTDKKIVQYIKNKKITKSTTRKMAHILADGIDVKKASGLKDKFRETYKFQDIRIDKDTTDVKQLMRLLKDLKKINQKYSFIHFDDKGYVDRIKRDLRTEEQRLKQDKLSKKDLDKLKKLTKRKKQYGSFKDFKF